jgi:hypothetical protein
MAERPALTIQTLRIICLALMGGMVLFTGAAAFVRTQGTMTAVPMASEVMPIVVALVFLSSIGVSFVVRSKLFGEAAKGKDESLRLLREDIVPPTLGSATIVSAALFEAPGLLGAITVMIGGPWACITAPILAIAAIAWLIPTRERFEEALRTAGS